jgi:hypothetical protein
MTERDRGAAGRRVRYGPFARSSAPRLLEHTQVLFSVCEARNPIAPDLTRGTPFVYARRIVPLRSGRQSGI